jgi:SAM-dependent methyltransferase
MLIQNPHFDENKVVWRDEYSGRYAPPPTGYYEQFDLEWKLALEGRPGYFDNPGACTEDPYIDDRIYEWTGKHPKVLTAGFADGSMGYRKLDVSVDPVLIAGKKAIDIGCGLGRWTRTMQRLGAASVLSIDISNSALRSVARFNPHVARVNIMEIPQTHPEWVGAFDFANFWGVAMCTHDPLQAFLSAASTVKPGGTMYLYVYAPEGMHAFPMTIRQRRHFHRLSSVDERLRYVDRVHERRWQADIPLRDNLRHVVRNLLGRPKNSKHGVLDSLLPFYNWVIPFDVIGGWAKKGGFASHKLLNSAETPKCGFHVLFRKAP